MSDQYACPVCDSLMRESGADWCFSCHACGFLKSTLRPSIGDPRAPRILDEERREMAFVTLRQKNFERILDRLATLAGTRQRVLLEVGCAHGWFLDAAARRGYEVHGVEPDAPIAALAMNKGHDVRIGYFPDALGPGTGYDFIVFNDVFEHLSDPRAALDACRQRLRPRGLLVLNLPNSKGVFFRTASLLARNGVRRPHERMWQKGFPSPHLSYFHPGTLARCAKRAGFKEVYRGTLASLDHRGLWQRLRMDRHASFTGAVLTWLAVKAVSPLLAWLPSDISLQIFAVEGE